MIKYLIFSVARSATFAKFIALLEQIDGERPNLLRVLTYHRVDEPEGPLLSPRTTLTPEVFDRQMRYLAANYHVISMNELLDVFTGQNRILPSRSALITFDDAYADFAAHAWPVLQRYRLPVTLFVPTAFPDQPERVFWWDWLYQAVSFTAQRDVLWQPQGVESPFGPLPLATPPQREQAFSRIRDYLKTLPHSEAMIWVEQICDRLEVPPPVHSVLGWEALRQLAREGVTLGPHTQTHPLMNRISVAEMRAEAIGSRRDLKREIGSALPIFAYPSGGLNDKTVRVLDEAGFVLAFTTRRGINDVRVMDRLRLRRINIGWRTTLAATRAQLLPWSMYLYR